MREVFIDLGEDWEIPVRPMAQRPIDPVRRRRTVLMAFLAGLIISTLMGAAPGPDTPAISELAIMSYPAGRGAVAFAGELILVSGGNGNVTAFEETGRARWHTKVSDLPSIASMSKVHDSVMVVADRGTEATVATTAIDPRTGDVRWRRPGSLEVVNDFAVLTYQESTISVFEAATMDPLWSLADAASHTFLPPTVKPATNPTANPTANPTTNLTANPTPSLTTRSAPNATTEPATMPETTSTTKPTRNLLVLTKSGQVQERDLSTGEVLASQQVSLPPGLRARIRVSRDRIVIFGIIGQSDSEDRLWLDAATLQPVPAGQHWADWRDCGPVWCGRIRGATRSSIVDKASGRVLRALSQGQNAIGTPAGLMTMLYRSDGTYSAVGLTDPLTGQVRWSLRGWQTVATKNFTDISQMLVWPSNGKTHLAVIRPSGLWVLGRVQHEIFGCLLEGSMLLCTTTEGKLGLWRINLS